MRVLQRIKTIRKAGYFAWISKLENSDELKNAYNKYNKTMYCRINYVLLVQIVHRISSFLTCQQLAVDKYTVWATL